MGRRIRFETGQGRNTSAARGRRRRKPKRQPKAGTVRVVAYNPEFGTDPSEPLAGRPLGRLR